MKRILFALTFALGLAITAHAQGDVVVYLNFDEQADGPRATDETPYAVGSTEIVNLTGTGIGSLDIFYNRKNANGDGPDIATPIGITTGTAQGGKALLTQGGPTAEGLMMNANTFMGIQDITVEIVWATTDGAAAANTAGIQTPWSNEWPSASRAQFFVRTVGANRFDYWTDRGDSHSEGVQVTTSSIPVNEWIHDVLVFDYNEVTPAASVITAYRNGNLVGYSPYDATGAPGAFFVDGGRAAIANGPGTLDVNPADPRGLIGYVDAFVLARGTRDPVDFYLPAGPPPITAADQWTLFE